MTGKNLSGQEFLDEPRKAITLMGMSGVGKTYFGCLLEDAGWDFYSCDYVIGTKHLALDVTPDDLTALSKFIGQLGNPDKGGLPFDEFKKRQRLYYEAECASVEEAADVVDLTDAHFICDSTGSLCEVEDDALLARLGKKTLFVYIKATPKEEQEVLKRAQQYPKPLFFPPSQFDAWLAEYGEVDDPADFARWVFPRLFESRLPKYQRLADLYGVTISSEKFKDVKTADDFLRVVAEALDDQNG